MIFDRNVAARTGCFYVIRYVTKQGAKLRLWPAAVAKRQWRCAADLEVMSSALAAVAAFDYG